MEAERRFEELGGGYHCISRARDPWRVLSMRACQRCVFHDWDMKEAYRHGCGLLDGAVLGA